MTGTFAALILIEHQVAVGRAVEHDFQVELLGDAKRVHDVHRALRGDQQRQLLREDLAERLHPQVARGTLVLGSAHLGDVVLRLDQLRAQHGDRLRACAGRLPRRSEAVVAERACHHRDRNHRGVFDLVADGLHDHRLARHEGAGRVAGVDRGHAVSAQPLDQHLTRVVGVDGSKLGLNRRRQLELHLVGRDVQRARQADDGVGVDQPGRRHRRRQRAITTGNLHVRRLADALDLAVGADQDDAVGDSRACHRVHRRRSHSNLRRGGSRERQDPGQRCNAPERDSGSPLHVRRFSSPLVAHRSSLTCPHRSPPSSSPSVSRVASRPMP